MTAGVCAGDPQIEKVEKPPEGTRWLRLGRPCQISGALLICTVNVDIEIPEDDDLCAF